MSRFHRYKTLLLIVVLVVVSVPASIWAINIVLEGFRVGIATTEIDAHNICKRVASPGGGQYFVPTRTSGEWTTFLSNVPSNVVVTDCINCLPNSRVSAPFFAGQQACAIRNNGQIHCWNSNTGANLAGTPTTTFSAVEIAGDGTTCGITTSGSIQCFWPGTFGAVNKPTTGTFVDIDNENAHFCGLRNDGQVRCWGRYLGFMSGDYGNAFSPSGTFRAVSVASTVACGVRTDDTVVCWGGYSPGIPTATQLAPLQNKGLQTIEFGYGVCGLDTTGKVICGNFTPMAQGFSSYTGTSTFSALEGTCGIKKSDGKLICPGVPAPIPTDSFISVDNQFSFNALMCGVTTAGVAKCWSNGTAGTLPLPTAGFNYTCG